VFNKAQWDKATIARSGTNPKIITGITLSGTDKAYGYVSLPKGVSVTCAYTRGTFTSGYVQSCNFILFKNNADAKRELDLLGKGLYVIVYENNDKGTNGDTAFEVLGEVNGLELLNSDRDSSSAENGGAWVLKFNTPSDRYEDTPSTVFIGSTTPTYATTLAALDALVA
jgi:hypothetical protein